MRSVFPVNGLQYNGRTVLSVPSGAEFVAFEATIYFVGDSTAEPVNRTFLVVYNQERVPDDAKYLATWREQKFGLTYHLFEVSQ
jgi:hypothetical protein